MILIMMIMMTLKTVKNTNYNDDAVIMTMMMRRKKHESYDSEHNETFGKMTKMLNTIIAIQIDSL